MLDRAQPITIIGAGIAGLTAALSLAKAGFRVEIREQAAELEEAGAGIQLSPNALRVLERLDLATTLAERALRAEAVLLRSAKTGKPIARVPVVSSDGTPYLSVHRADLQQALLAAIERHRAAINLQLGRRLTECIAEPEGMLLHFAAAESEVRRVVVAADGVHSRVAAEMGYPAATPSGLVAWRLLLPAAAVRPQSHSISGIEAWLGPSRHAVAYPVRGGDWINLVLICPLGDRSIVKGEAIAATDLLPRFRNWDLRLREMIAAGGSATGWPLAHLPRPRWSSGENGLLMIGDAAHAMLPFAAQGAAMAIEDAWVAAYTLARASDASEAAMLFRQMRARRIEQARRRTAFHQLVYHLPPPLASARDLALAMRSPQSLRRDLAWLYDWQPPAF